MGGTSVVVFRAEPGKQKTRSCRAQELARSSAHENVRQKKEPLLNAVKIGRLAQPVA
jgi:hypothetical protein